MTQEKSIPLTPEGIAALSDEELEQLDRIARDGYKALVGKAAVADFMAKHARQTFEDRPRRESFIDAGVFTQVARNAKALVEAHARSFQPLFDEIERRKAG